MHESRITRRWLRDECQSAIPALKFWWVRKPTADPSAAFGRYLVNRNRDVMMTPLIRAWDESVWIVEVVVPEDLSGTPDPFQKADAWAALIDQRLNPGGRPRVNIQTPYGGEIVSCQRASLIEYMEPRADDADRIHRGGMYKIRTKQTEEVLLL